MKLVGDLLLYVGSIQLLLLWILAVNPRVQKNFTIFSGFAVSVLIFWLVWGGYSVDAWRYLSGFDHSPFDYRQDQLFWIAGHYLAHFLQDPWPLKVLSSAGAGLLCWAFYQHLRDEPPRMLLLAYILLLTTPGFYLLSGNAVRQGLAGAISVLAITLFFRFHRKRWLALFVLAFFAHKFSLIMLLAFLVALALRRHVVWFWLFAIAAGLSAQGLANALGVNISQYIPYASYQEGDLHWIKFFVSAVIGVIVSASLFLQPVSNPDFRHVYIGLLGFSGLFLAYEVPYERLLLFSDLVAPLALAGIVFMTAPEIRSKLVIAAAVVSVATSLLLLTNKSIILSLGYA